ncbi:Endoribonuclease Dicer homolog 3b-like protein [Drosera capensis]
MFFFRNALSVEVLLHSHFNCLFRQNHFTDIGFDDRTIIIWDQELSTNNMFCYEDCNRIHISLVDHNLKGVQPYSPKLCRDLIAVMVYGGIDSCVSAAESMKKSASLSAKILRTAVVVMEAKPHSAYNILDCRSEGEFPILESLTTLRCCETFSMERLELLGDSVLKYTMSCLLFLKYPEKHEGQLSARRSLAICNASLYKFRTYCQLQVTLSVNLSK